MILQRSLILSILLGFVFSTMIGPLMIPALRRVKAGQSIREDGPQTHLIKAGTPTMGGLIMIPSSILAVIILTEITYELKAAFFSFLGFAIIGLIDDYLKVVLKRPLGLRAYQKMGLQIFVTTIFIGLANHLCILPEKLFVPYARVYIDLGILWIPFLFFVIIGTVNSVNLTDGLDGLASGITVIVTGFFSLVAWHMGYQDLAWFAGAVSGSCIGFLVYNIYPAKIFMGDTGSLALGGAIAALAVITNMTLLLPIVGGVFFIETLSVMIQVAGYKTTGKRVFRMSPLHHHFELCGWSETRVVTVFWGVTIILCLAGILGIQ
ncbi:phospho-N-acetylmuramoyl-pentapeptide-transferase [Tindallia californiensis]|uniref:Phospho-N-acetylmuramoyl-pentapeptide-transferase n=1 Tax=Tindallia californiensis TaxID=159292 RepID=A0A1H3JPW2_9FIRM|nr:phospho-N-acetylmuramoyl-pentapeptide-transferase [Tindallia californiensis]SDY41973.1 Phospho-N-acetylmuramoyl-pentapeptide-transferase [Tindallia californiensis]